MEYEKHIQKDCLVAAEIMNAGGHFPNVQDTLKEAADYIEKLEAQLAAADVLADIVHRTGYRVDAHGQTTLLDADAMLPITAAFSAYREARK
jgi:hypothetical protein